MKRTLPTSLLSVLTLLCTIGLSAQELVQISYGPSYKNQTYYRLSDDQMVSIDNNSWDIAFTTFGNGDAGIHLNESTVTFGAETALFLAPTNNFDDPNLPADLTQRRYNDEVSWEHGAFNSTRDVNDPNDFGWGVRDDASGNITGNMVFALRFKDGSYKKLQIVSLEQGVYTLKHADLDGSNEVTLTVAKASFPDADFAYLSLASGQTLPSLPIDWDLAFIRYAAVNPDGAGGTIQIMSSGVLSAPGVEVAQADFVVPSEAEFADYEDSLSTRIDIIGSDWKIFNNTTWILANDRAYFVKTTDGEIYKLVFLEFSGSTGNAIFSKELIMQTAVAEVGALSGVSLYPNPATDQATLLFSVKNAGAAQISLSNLFGQTAWTGTYDARAGFNAAQIPVNGLPAGQYLATVRLGADVVTQRLVKQ